MKKILFTIGIALGLMFIGNVYAQGTINYVSGLVDDGETVFIEGSGFGTKSPVAPIYWSKFNEGPEGSSLTDIDTNWQTYSSYEQPKYTNNAARTGSFGLENIYKSGFNCANILFTPEDEVFISYWYYMETPITTGCTSHKMTRINSTPVAGGGGYYNQRGSTQMGRAPMSISNREIEYSNGLISEGDDNEYHGVGYLSAIYNEWFGVKMYRKQSTPGGNDGEVWGSFNSQTIIEENANTVGEGFDFQSNTIWLNVGGAGCVDGLDLYLDDMYIDNTQKRVELGNANTYASSTQLEMQIPKNTWEDGTIEIEFNKGTFTNEDLAWLYVIDENNNPSAGYEIIIGSVVGTTDPNITNRNGAMFHGNSITLTGSNFGSKDPVEPYKYSDFQALNVGDYVPGKETGSDGFYTINNVPGTFSKPVISVAKQRYNGDKVTFHDLVNGGNSTIGLFWEPMTKMYVSVWEYRDDPNGNAFMSENQKIWGNFGKSRSTDSYTYPQTRVESYWGGTANHLKLSNASFLCTGYIDCNGDSCGGENHNPSYNYTRAYKSGDEHNQIFGEWFRAERWMDMGGAQANHAYEGYVSADRPGQTAEKLISVSGWDWAPCESINPYPYDYFALFHSYTRTWYGDGERAGMYAYLSEIYMDSTLAKVEIGNEPIYDACTHKEIQLPHTTWENNGNIQITVNTGSFNIDDNIWIYVVDENGTASNGFGPITIVPPTDDPYITNHDGSLVDGTSMTLTGGNFGTKYPVAPVAWADMTEPEYDGLTQNTPVPTQTQNDCPECIYETRAADGYPPYMWTDSVDLRHHGNPVISTQYGAFQPAIDMRSAEGADTSYKTYMFYYLRTSADYYHTDGAPAETKVVRIWDHKNDPNIYKTSFEYGYTMVKLHSTNCITDAAINDAIPDGDLLPVRRKWYSHEVYMDMTNANESGGGVLIQTVDDMIYTNRSDLAACPGNEARHLIWQNGAGCSSDSWSDIVATTPDARIWWTDIYADITPARVMLGNENTWVSSDHREIQIPHTTWNDNTIRITVNTGSFSPGEEVWLYVMDGDNTPSNGHGPIIIPESTTDPYIDEITSGVLTDGTPMTITGGNFGVTQGNVYIGDENIYASCNQTQAQTVTSWLPAAIDFTVEVGPFFTDDFVYLFAVDNGAIPSLGHGPIQIIGVPGPQIQNVQGVPDDGELIQISGLNFGTTEGNVYIGNAQNWVDVTVSVEQTVVPGSWYNQLIQITVDTGTFTATDNTYLFVYSVDSSQYSPGVVFQIPYGFIGTPTNLQVDP